MPRFGLLIITERCQGCQGCVVGCKNWHGDPAGAPGRIRLVDLMTGDFPEIQRWVFPVLCMHCTYPACVAVCRFDACTLDSHGVVSVSQGRCVGCGLCVLACPYGIRLFKPDGKVAAGCDFCLDRVDNGQNPYCVATCPTQAIIFGDLDDAESNISREIQRKKARPLLSAYRTRPRVFYTQADKIETLIAQGTRHKNHPRSSPSKDQSDA